MTPLFRLLSVALVLSSALAPAALAADDPPSVPTYFRLLVGRPEPAPGGAAVLVVTGTVVVPGESGSQKAADLMRVIDQLKDAYRLAQVEPAAASFSALSLNQSAEAASMAAGPRVEATLVAADDKTASYRVTLSEAGKLLAEPVVNVRRGGRAIVGGRNGEAAPYFFVLVEPLAPFPPRGPRAPSGAASADSPISEPKLVKRVLPAYPAEAKEARLEGIVLLEATVAKDGRVTDIKVVRGEPMGLTEAAMDAVKQWEYEPARNSTGTPVAVVMTLTVRFALK